MRLLHLLIVFLLLTMLPLSSGETGKVREKVPKEWTILVYMNGDNSLEAEAVNDLNEMEQVGSGERVNIVVQVDRTAGYDSRMDDWTDTRRYYILPDGGDPELNSLRMDGGLGELDMADPKVLKDFLVWGIGNFPARHYMLVLWDHGTGIFRYSRAGQRERGPTRGVSSDITSGKDMEMVQAAWALEEALNTTGLDRIDIVGFDLCSLGQVETAYQFSPVARYMVASFDEEPAPGWNYTTLLSPLLERPLSPVELSIWAVEAYQREYTSGKEYKSLAATDLEVIAEEVLPLLNDLSRKIYCLNYTQLQRMAQIRDLSHRPWRKEIYRDVGDMLLKLGGEEAMPEDLREEAAALREVLSRAILRSFAGEMHPKAALGIGIYFPRSYFDEYYSSNIALAETFWDEAVKRVLEPFDFRDVRLNDTVSSAPGVTFEAHSSTPQIIQDVWVAGQKDSGEEFFKGMEGSGHYRAFVSLEGGIEHLTYHFEVISSRYRFRFPLEGELEIHFGEDREPPEGEIIGGERRSGEVWIYARVRDNFGIETEGVQLHLFTPLGTTEVIPPGEVRYDPFSGWVQLGFSPGILPGGYYKTYLQVEDTSGNSVRAPQQGWQIINITEGVRLLLDLPRSDMRAFSLLNETLKTSLGGISHPNGTLKSDDLEGVDIYLVIEPTMGYSEEELEVLQGFVEGGGAVLALLSPENPKEAEATQGLGEMIGITADSGMVWKVLRWNNTFPPFSGLGESKVSGTMYVKGGAPLLWGDDIPAGAITERGILLPSAPFRDAFFSPHETAFLSLLFYLSGPAALSVILHMEGGSWVGEGIYHIAPGDVLNLSVTTSPALGGEVLYRVLWGDGGESTSHTPIFNHTYTVSGNLTLRVEVSSSEGAGFSTVRLVVDHPPEIDFTVDPPSPRSWEWIYFNATVRDLDGTVVEVQWDFGDGYTAEGIKAVHYYSKHGTYRVRVRAVDDVGISAERLFTMVIADSPPDGEISPVAFVSSTPTSIMEGVLKVKEGDVVLLEGRGEDKDGDSLRYLWLLDGRRWEGRYLRVQFNISGIYDIELIVEDLPGLTAHDSVRVIVENLPPRAKISYIADGKRFTFYLEGEPDTGSDSRNLKVRWYFGDGERGEGLEVEHIYRFGGRYRVRVVVQDPEGERDEDYVTVEVPGVTLGEIVGVTALTIIISLSSIILYRLKRRG